MERGCSGRLREAGDEATGGGPGACGGTFRLTPGGRCCGKGPALGASPGRASPPWMEVAAPAGAGQGPQRLSPGPRLGHRLPGVSPLSLSVARESMHPASQDVPFGRASFRLFFNFLPTRPGTQGLFSPSCRRTLVTASGNRKPDPYVTESGGLAACCSKANVERHV